MKISIQSALEILAIFEEDLRPIDRICQYYFKERPYLGSKDRRGISELVYDIMRHRSLLAYWAKELKLPQTYRSFLLIYFRKEPLAALFSGDKFSPPRLSEKEKKALKRCPENLNDPSLPPSIIYGYPAWMEASLVAAFGERLGEELAALSQRAPFDLRANPLIATRSEVQKNLEQEGLSTASTPFSPLGLRTQQRFALDQTELFKQGQVEVQDEGSQLICFLTDVKPAHQVMDFCAGAGGKTLLLSALMNNKGHIVATDIHDKRLQEARKRLRRAKVENAHCKVIAHENDISLARYYNKMDRVLVDAPCSGAGTWRRNPDLKWRFTARDLKDINYKQQSILQAAALCVKQGGRLIYATCSIFAEENEHQIEKFLMLNPSFKLLSIKPIWEEKLEALCPCAGPYLRLSPYKHDTDGFFAAILEKTS